MPHSLILGNAELELYSLYNSMVSMYSGLSCCSRYSRFCVCLCCGVKMTEKDRFQFQLLHPLQRHDPKMALYKKSFCYTYCTIA